MIKKMRHVGIALFLFSVLGTMEVHGQTMHNPRYDIAKKIHFGFTIGTNFMNLDYRLSDEFYPNDTLLRVNMKQSPGIVLGAIANWHIRERLDLRTMPSLILAQRTLSYTFKGGTPQERTVESVYLDVPLLLKYKSVRHRNVRFYVLGGGKVSYDIASEEGTERDPVDPNVALRRLNYYGVFGCGFDLYLPFFKFSPEITFAQGLNDVLDPHDAVFSSAFSQLNSSMFMISLNFE